MQLHLRMASTLLRYRTYIKSVDTGGVKRQLSYAGQVSLVVVLGC